MSTSHRWIRVSLLALVASALAVASAAAAAPRPAAGAPKKAGHSSSSHAGMHMGGTAASQAPLFSNLGTWHRPISTKNAQAQRYFDQGMRLMWGFNLEEAQRSFEEAARLDPTCAMCEWGVAFSLGPHINLPGIPERTKPANAAAQKALALEAGASDVERALIEAIAKRYSDPPPTDPRGQFALDSTYSAAMHDVAQRFPADDDIQALYVESLMDLHPWDYWNADGTAQPWTAEIVDNLEKILARNPRHPGANHYYIHAEEASPHPENALASADRLRDMMPGAGHMAHMPAHIYQRIAKYDDANAANVKGVAADRAYTAIARPQGFYHMYMSHNSHFLAWTYMVQGRSVEALRASRDAAAQIDPAMARAMVGTDFFIAEPMFVMARFGRWKEALQVPVTPEGLPYMRGIRHYVRGLAYAGTQQFDAAATALDSLTAIRDATPDDAMEGFNSAKALLTIAVHVLTGETALARGQKDEAVKHLEEAVKGEDATRYDESPDWIYPTRHYLGRALLADGRAADAETVYREDLRRNPENGWSLFGLTQSLKSQGKTTEAAATDAKFRKAWTHADVKLTASAF